MKKYNLFLIVLMIFSTQLSFAQNWRWAKQFGNYCDDYSSEITNNMEGAVSLVIDGNGNSYFLTKFRSETSIGDIKLDGLSLGEGYGGKNDIGIISFDSNGRHRWTKLIGSKGNDRGIGLKIDSLGGVYVTANSAEASGGAQLLLYDMLGRLCYSGATELEQGKASIVLPEPLAPGAYVLHLQYAGQVYALPCHLAP